MRIIYGLIFFGFSCISYSQEIKQDEKDSIISLSPVTVTGLKVSPERRTEITQNVIYSGKKNEILNLSKMVCWKQQTFFLCNFSKKGH